MLNQHLWGEDWGSMSNIIDVHINRLRRKIDRGHDQPLIQTVRGRGYVLKTT
jgi:DNA-binding response OmpR family regulator